MTSISTTRRLAAAGLCAIAAATATTSTAQAATIEVDLGSGPIVSVDTQATADTVAAVRTTAIDLVQAKLRQANAGVLAPTARSVQSVLRGTGVTTYAIVDSTGRVLRGPSVVSVHSRRGMLDVGWSNDFRGCLQVALSNTLVPQALTLDLSMPLHTRVKTGRAATKASLRNVTVAVVC
ncbi:MAG TPA: hypothetical protein VFZ89_01995 [Solirubrobacteraceae bacterium]